MEKPTTNRELWAFIIEQFGVALPWQSYTPGHSSPFNFVADAFFNPGKDVAAWACRSGGKTLGASIIARLEHMWQDGVESRVLSGSKDQAKFLYGYWDKWCQSILPNQVSGDILMSKTKINGGVMEILAASHKQVRGGKVQRLFIDEVDEVDWDLMEAAEGMGASRPDMPARTVYGSTWHRVDGSMGKLVGMCPGNGVTLHRWNLWECIAQCGEDRHEHGKNCSDCPLGEDCLNARKDYWDARNGVLGDRETNWRVRSPGIAAERHGIFTVEDAIKRYTKLSRATIDAEYLCKRPSPEGMVYPSFDTTKHVIAKAPEHLTIYRAIDWGHGVFVCLWLGMDKDGVVYLLDTYRAEHRTVKQNYDYIKDHAIKNIPTGNSFCDPAGNQKQDQTGRSNVQEFRSYGLPLKYRTDKFSVNVQNGIKMVKNHLNPASGPPRFFIVDTPANRVAMKALESYHNTKINEIYIDKPKDPQEYEHIPDALRYFFVNATQGSQVMTVRG